MSPSQPPFRFSLTLESFSDGLQALSFSVREVSGITSIRECRLRKGVLRSAPSQRKDCGLLLAHVQQEAYP